MSNLDIDSFKWEKREEEDKNNFYNEIWIDYDGRGIVGDQLFPLTFDYKNALNDFRDVDTITGERITKEIFYALCPELESFISIRSWVGSEKSRNKERIFLHRKFEEFKKGMRIDEILKISGNYRISKDNFGQILLFRSNTGFEKKNMNFYSWERVPFLKRSGEIFSYRQSPVFMSPVHSKEDGIVEEKNTYFVMLFKYTVKQNNNIANLELYNATNQYSAQNDFHIKYEKIHSILRSSRKPYLGLFKERVYKKNKEYHRDFELVEISEEIEAEDIIAHFITMKLYFNFLLADNLRICSKDDFNSLINRETHHTQKRFDVRPENLNFFKELYLSEYFREIEGNIYYRPYFLHDKDDNFIKKLEKRIGKRKDKMSEIELLEFMKEQNKFGPCEKQLFFLKKYKYYQKRTLIDILRIHIEKWKLNN